MVRRNVFGAAAAVDWKTRVAFGGLLLFRFLAGIANKSSETRRGGWAVVVNGGGIWRARDSGRGRRRGNARAVDGQRRARVIDRSSRSGVRGRYGTKAKIHRTIPFRELCLLRGGFRFELFFVYECTGCDERTKWINNARARERTLRSAVRFIVVHARCYVLFRKPYILCCLCRRRAKHVVRTLGVESWRAAPCFSHQSFRLTNELREVGDSSS